MSFCTVVQTMKPKIRKPVEKTTVRFDEESRRQYLTGFHKRKKQRQKKAKLKKSELEKEVRKDLKRQKRAELTKKLKVYGLDDTGGTTEEPHSQTVASQPNVICYDHPDHVVVVNTQPVFSSSLTSLLDENSDSETASAPEDTSSRKSKKLHLRLSDSMYTCTTQTVAKSRKKTVMKR